jgi:hypothetical protein
MRESLPNSGLEVLWSPYRGWPTDEPFFSRGFPTRDHTAVDYLVGANLDIETMMLSSLRVLFRNRIFITPLRRRPVAKES